MIESTPEGTATETGPRLRLAEVVASLALATDLSAGQPLEHGLRRTLLAVWLCEELGLDSRDASTTYYVALLGAVGCILDGAALADMVRDEISVRGRMVLVDPTKQLNMAAFFFREAGSGDPPLRRLRKFLSLSRQQRAVCRDVALQVGGLLDLGPDVRQALGQCDEHWSGKGGMLGLKGEDINLAARLFVLCHDVEIFNRVSGVDAALTILKERSGKVYDPRIVDVFQRVGPGLVQRLSSQPAWEAVLDHEPQPVRFLSMEDFEDVALQVANFVDVRSPYTLGHSAAVAGLAESTALGLKLSRPEAVTLRHAGLLHDLGRAGIPASTWNKAGPLSEEERERMQRHPSLTELLLSRSTSLGHLGMLAGMHHEKIDGSGYRAMPGVSLPLAARILAAADTYRTKLEARPHRAALAPGAAADEVLAEVRAGRMDAEVVDALLRVAGQRSAAAKKPLPAGLSEREAEVLALAVRGMPNRQIAETLVLSPKTVGRHIENIYNKIGVSTRVGATLFAVQHGLVEDTSPA